MIRVDEVAAAFWLASGDVEKAGAHAIAALEQAKQTLSRKHIAWSRKLLGDVASHQERYAEAARMTAPDAELWGRIGRLTIYLRRSG